MFINITDVWKFVNEDQESSKHQTIKSWFHIEMFPMYVNWDAKLNNQWMEQTSKEKTEKRK